MSTPSQETYFNTKSKTKYDKHSLWIDPKNDPVMEMIVSLFDFHQKWVAKEGALPEEIDRRCIDLLGMRFQLLLESMFSVHVRKQLIDAGQISDYETPFFRVEVEGCESHEISQEEHEDLLLCMNKLLEYPTNNLTTFLDSLSDFAI